MTARQFWRAMLQTTLVTSVVTILLISGYLALLMRLPTEQWRGFAEIVGGLFLVLFALTSWVNQRYFGSVVAYLRGREAGEDDAQVLRTAFVDLSALPYRMLLSALFWWSLGGSVVAAAMALRYDTFQGYQGAVMVAAAASGGFVTSIFLYFIHKWIYAPLRSELAAEIADSEERGRLVHRVPLHRKLLVGVCGVTFVSVTFAMFLAFAATGRHLESFVANSQSALLSELVSAPEGLAGEALSAAEANARRLGIARHLILLDGESGEVLAGDPHALYESERRAVLRSKGSGDSLSFDSPNSVTWQRLDGGAVLVAALPWEAISGSGDGWIFALMIAFTASTSLGIAFTLARDVGTATRELSDEVQRLASGDLTAGRIFDSEDELGDLWRSVESMAAALRETVGRVALAADRVEGSSGSIARVSQAVAGGAAQQGEGVGQAIALMDGINGRVLEIAQSAQELNLLVEESSSSILEMGAAGEELNDTAGVLSSKTDEVSSSVEEMVRSVREVAGQTEVLSEASAETSASMEQMAAAMRQVDSTAEQSAKLSAGVIERAEGGHEKVRRTIEGMESIRAATETAERVIRGLGARTAEIGAILDVIDDVADETNLLALNAAIIAAQAGDHGRAFSVVADEIKELADRVLASTKEIGGLIRSVQQESANAVGAIEEGARSVASGVELSMQAGGALEEITSASRDSGDCMQEIVHAVREQTKAAGHVVGLMERVSEGIEAIRHASAEQERGNDVVSRSTVATREVAQQLRGTTEEQARGGARIRESTDGVREAVEAINRALQIQTESTAELASFLEQVATRSSANVESAGQMRSATDELSTESESLREQVARFRV